MTTKTTAKKPRRAKKPSGVLNGRRIIVPVCALELDPDGTTLWVQGLRGTVVRIQALGGLEVTQCGSNPCTHTDVQIDGKLSVCISGDAFNE